MVNVTTQSLALSLAVAQTDGRPTIAGLAKLGEPPAERDVAKLREARELLTAKRDAESRARTAAAPSRPGGPAANAAEIARLKEQAAGYTKALGRLLAAHPAPKGSSYTALVVGTHGATGGKALAITGEHVRGIYTQPSTPHGFQGQWDPVTADTVTIRARTVDSVYTGGGADAVAVAADEVSSVYTGNEADAVAIAARHVQSVYLDNDGASADAPLRAGNDAAAIAADTIVGVYGGAGADALTLRGDIVARIDGGEGQDAIHVTAGWVEQVQGGDGNDALVVDAEIGAGVVESIRHMEIEGAAGAGDPLLAVGRYHHAGQLDVDGGHGNDAISLRVGTAVLAQGGRGNDTFALSGDGTVGLVYGDGDGHDTVALGSGTAVVLHLRDQDHQATFERSGDDLVVRLSRGGSVTFHGLAGSGSIAVMGGPGSTTELTILWEGRPTVLDRTA